MTGTRGDEEAKSRRVDVDQEHAGADLVARRIEGGRHDDVERSNR
jgi:hypothetical protein